MTVIVFNTKTIPDIEGGRRLYNLASLSEKEVANVMFYKRRQEGNDAEGLRHHLHRIVAISVVMHEDDRFKVWSLGEVDTPEAELIHQFFDLIERHRPSLVSWSGGGFDLPVLNYRALVHGLRSPHYWEAGRATDGALSHTELLSHLAGLQPQEAAAPLHELATLMGFPGRLGMDASRVWDSYRAGHKAAIRHDAETEALTTFLVYLRLQLFRGHLTHADYDEECQQVRATLERDGSPHLTTFLATWSA